MVNLDYLDAIHTEIARCDALLECFEHNFLQVVDLGGNAGMKQRNKACLAFYAIRDLLSDMLIHVDDLAGQLE